ncbi:MAG: domain S-box/diguanylate cyclase protein [Rhodocyclaceae bacterium]|nr:domain S-box/diguanylate cyclase protein [Rhodocyclaceae bacterium]
MTLLTASRLWLLAVVPLAVLAALYHWSSVDDDGLHRVEVAANELVALDIAANLEIMKLRHRHKLDYDELAAAARRGQELLDQLEPEFARLDLKPALEPARHTWQEKLAGIERFKQINAIFSTSQFHFINLAESLESRKNSPLLNRVSRRVLAFLMQGSSEELPVLVSSIYQLAGEIDGWPEADRAEGKLLVTHGTLILEQYRRAQQLSQGLLESPFAGTVAAAYRTYAIGHRKATARANQYRQVMAGFALLLAAAVILAAVRLRQSGARLRLAARVFDNLAEAMVITDGSGNIQSVNPAFTTITGYSEEEAQGRKPGDLLASGQHDPAFFTRMWTVLRENGQWQGEIINRRKNGETYTEWLSISAMRGADNRVVQYIGLFSDISDRKEAEAYIHHLAYHDPLTGLANRLLFRDRLDTALRQAQRSNRPLAVLMMDLDRFKNINDTLGHHTGDRLLKEVAHRLSCSVRDCDTLARLGGDEFALLMPEIRSADDAAGIAGKLVQMLAPEIDLEVQEVFITTSIGIAVFPEHGKNSDQLLRNADVALYVAKNAGRNTWHVFDPASEMAASDRLELETALRHAVARDELVLYYQVQMDATDNRISGVEALIRWQHPQRGLLAPDRFIPLAEQTGLIEEIGAWCLETACRQLARWQLEGIPVPRMAVNVSARQLRAQGFTELVMDTISRTGIQPGQLELELTETMLSDDPSVAFAIFTELRRHGVRIAIDDFGTGYSSLNYLAQFPVDVIKIDRSFVRNLDGQSEASDLVRAIILLAQSMKMETVAEGVEVDQQQTALTSLGCDHLQGFLFAKPQPPEAFPGLVKHLAGLAPAEH